MKLSVLQPKAILIVLSLLSAIILCGTWRNAAAYTPTEPTDITITRVSVATGGLQANDESFLADISADGRYVVFVSGADNLVVNDTNETNDIFVHDRQRGITERVSVANDGGEADSFSTAPVISADGRFVVFTSGANNLVESDTFSGGDIFLRDRVNGRTTLISVNSAGLQSNGNSYGPAISPDGNYIAFVSTATNLDERITSSVHGQIYLHKRSSGETRLISVNRQDQAGNNLSGNFLGKGIAVSNGGTSVAFVSRASNLVDDDTNEKSDLFLYRVAPNILQRISTGRGGAQSNGNVGVVQMSDNGQQIVFDSDADNLIAGDVNENYDVFVYNVATGSYTLASRTPSDTTGEGADPDISGDGRYVTYASNTGLHVAGDCNAFLNCVYRYDTLHNETTLISINAEGGPAGNHTQEARIAGDGSAILFQSLWDGYVPNDTNEVPDLFVYSEGSAAPVVAAEFAVDVRQAPDGRFILPWGSDADLLLPLRLARSYATTVTVPIRVTDPLGEQTVHQLAIPPGTTESTFVLKNPQATEPLFYQVAIDATGRAEQARQSAVPQISGFDIGFWIPLGDEDCYLLSWCLLMSMAGWHTENCFDLRELHSFRLADNPLADNQLPGNQFSGDHSVQPMAEATMLETLYTTRDQLMATTVAGRYYTNLYYTHTAELTAILLQQPTVLWETWDGMMAWLPALRALNAGEGVTVTITQAMVDDLETVLTLFTDHGSDALRTTITTEAEALVLDSFVDMTVAQAWEQVNQRPVHESYLPVVIR